MSDRAYALRFISGKYQGGEYPLSDAGELVIGRSSELDMVLIEDMVSRKHAKLTLASDQITIADLSHLPVESRFVAMMPQWEFLHFLADEARQHGGPDPLVVGRQESGQHHQERGGVERVGLVVLAEDALLGHPPLQDLGADLVGHRAPAPLELPLAAQPGQPRGAIHRHPAHQLGRHVVARSPPRLPDDADPTLPPRKALYRMVSWTQGGFEFVPQEGDLPPMPSEIVEATEQLVVEAMQQADELSRGGFPASTAAVGIAMPLSPRLRELSAEELDLLQLVHNYGVVQAVLDRAAGSDLEVSKKIASLIERGYLRRF